MHIDADVSSSDNASFIDVVPFPSEEFETLPGLPGIKVRQE